MNRHRLNLSKREAIDPSWGDALVTRNYRARDPLPSTFVIGGRRHSASRHDSNFGTGEVVDCRPR